MYRELAESISRVNRRSGRTKACVGRGRQGKVTISEQGGREREIGGWKKRSTGVTVTN